MGCRFRRVWIAGLLLALVWLGVWVGGFSAAATKLPNYVLPAYPAAALLTAIVAVDAARRASTGGWPHPHWMAIGVASLAFGAGTVSRRCGGRTRRSPPWSVA